MSLNSSNFTSTSTMTSNVTTINSTTTTTAATTTMGLFPEFYDTYDSVNSEKKRLKPSQIFGLVVGGGGGGGGSGGGDYDDGSILVSTNSTGNKTSGGLLFDDDDDYLATIPTSNDPTAEPIISQLKTPLFYILFMLVVYGLIILVVFASALYAHRKRADYEDDDDEDYEDDEIARSASSVIRHMRLREERDEDEVAPHRASKVNRKKFPPYNGGDKNEIRETSLTREHLIKGSNNNNKSNKNWESDGVDEEEDDENERGYENELENRRGRERRPHRVSSSTTSSSSCGELIEDEDDNDEEAEDYDDDVDSSSLCSEPELDEMSRMRPIPPTGQRNWCNEWDSRANRRKKCTDQEADNRWGKLPEAEPLVTLSSSVFNKTESEDTIYQPLVVENRL